MKKVVVAGLIILALVVGIVIGSTIIGRYKIGYTVKPVEGDAPSQSPPEVSLDLGDITALSIGEKDFGKVASINLPLSYKLTATFSGTPLGFESFSIYMKIYDAGTTNYVTSISTGWAAGYAILEAGSYDIHIEVDYVAGDVSAATTGETTIELSY